LRRAARALGPGLYPGLAVLLTAAVVAGFWPYFRRVAAGTLDAPWFIHLHAAVFVGWLALLLTQACLVSAGLTRHHRRLGVAGIAYGVLVLAMGLLVSFAAPAGHVDAGRWDEAAAAAFLLLPLGDLVLFAGLFCAAIAWRARPQVHKRLMLCASVALVFPAVARLGLFEISPWLLLLVWLSPLIIAMAHDMHSLRRVHPAYLAGTTLLAAGYVRVFFMDSPAWLALGGWLLSPFLLAVPAP
jgi:hypothetical protein